jgi:nucleoid DNA-binding protein
MLTDGNDALSSPAGKLTKTDLIEEVSRVTELRWQEAAVVVERILDSMIHAIERGDKVEIRGFGTFRTRQRQGRVARNPKPARRSKCGPNEFRASNPARNSATW